MKILVDENMPYAEILFKRLGNVQTLVGREISVSALLKADALMVRSITRIDGALLNRSRVKFVGTATSGTDHVDIDWLSQAGISFSSAPGCNAIAVVEYVFSALLWLAQRDGFALRDKTLGIIGVGNIGSRLQRRLNAFGVSTLLCDPPLAEAGVPGDWQSLETLVAKADILTFHTPLTFIGRHATWHQVDETLLSALPAGRIIINTCRGAVVDNAALLRVLEGGKSLSVVLDVWETEPKILLPLLDHIDIGTAHIAGYTLEGKARGTTQIFDAYSAYIGSNERANLIELLPLPTVRCIRLNGNIDEEMLRLLIHLVYDVRRDDARLRHTTGLPTEFDLLRKNYYHRREWSSLCVETDDDISLALLQKLGFKARLFSE
ncbi:Erythronate-4-phosphate dehydrogenase [Candidatus Gullanella endobia]|uniref:Erythronate-4-phosphate dehydrogenase n=1 Tax=Candidatus Gullanella endobia TaxID=1070130 RepID=A0A143WQI3_9ENTR|nr:4-phosphoerythronate dehydrogenase [Candidatus Gullanella endobia]CUX96036.1 Erythronate-4-phosphate dehydrogenase [Candidatus Gullanella endobia]